LPTKRIYRRAFAQLIGPYIELTATSGSTTSQIECTQWPFYSSNVQNELFQDWFMMRAAATTATDMVRLVPEGGYTPASGLIVPDQQYTVSPYVGGVGELIEAHGVLDPGFVVDMLINEALKQTLVVHEVTLAPTADYTRHLLSTTYSWLTEPKWIRQVGFLGPSEDRNKFDPYQRVVYGGGEKIRENVYFVTSGQTFTSNETLYFKLLVPAYDLCRASGGTFGDRAGLRSGVLGETDEAIPQAEWVAWGALVEAWTRFGHILDAQVNNRILRDAETAGARFTALSQQYLDVPAFTGPPMIRWGPL
jgi:hypothetical protein